jgi:hypothetical protein
MVKSVTSLQNYSKSHPNNNIVLMFDQNILYANHYEKQVGELNKDILHKGIDYKTFIKNDLNYLDMNVVHYWHYNKVKHEVKYSNFYSDSDFMYYYPMHKIMEEMDYQDDDLPITPELQLFHDEFTKAFTLIELNGIGVNTNIISTFGHRMAKYIHDRKIYQNYNFYTTTSRPSNSINNLNFAALTPEHRKCFSPLNDIFIEFDFDAYHPRLIGDLIGYDFPNTPVHEYLSNKYKVDVSEGKTKTFQYLYGGIPNDVANKIEFLNMTKNLINEMWDEFNQNKRINSHIYNRPMKDENLENLNAQKLFNYYIQSYETERNVKLLMKLHTYLLTKKTKIVHYNYDSFLFDYSKEDGVETIHEIKQILETNGFTTKTKVGSDYGSIKNYEF